MPRTIFRNIVIQHYERANQFSFCKYTSIRFFEILYFETGEGYIRMNNGIIPYSSGSIFVFIPDDVYIVVAESTTTVTTIKFLKSFFSENFKSNSVQSTSHWFRKMENILHSNNHQLPTVVFKDHTDQINIAALVNIINKENNNKLKFDKLIIENSLTIILRIIARNVEYGEGKISSVRRNTKIQDIINYIHLNIYDADLLTNTNFAMEFNMSENYISQYFKKYMGISLKKYILTYKLKIVETKLTYTDMSYTEIAAELDFTDASHLNKAFKSYKGMSVGSFKAQLL